MSIPASRKAAEQFAVEIRRGVWRYLSGPTRGKFAPTVNGLPLEPGNRKDRLGRIYNVAKKRAVARQNFKQVEPPKKKQAKKRGYKERFGIVRLGGLPSVYIKVEDLERLQDLESQWVGYNFLPKLIDWAEATFPAGGLPGMSQWSIVGHASQATNWRSWLAHYKGGQLGGWYAGETSITNPDPEHVIDSAGVLLKQYEVAAKGSPTPSVPLLIPVKRISEQRWVAQKAAWLTNRKKPK